MMGQVQSLEVPIFNSGRAKCRAYSGLNLVEIEVQVGNDPHYIRTTIRLDSAAIEGWIEMLTNALGVLEEADHA